jgi:glyoxylase-like metal-dependent hydrolase (beta-lactamase superfamily II)
MTLRAVPLAPGLSYVDLQFLGHAGAIATGVVGEAGDVALVDPGPTSCLDTLELTLNGQGLGLDRVSDILLTHIHLDHAGATGTIVRRHPRVRVWVHERGARHLIDPAKLLSSATRLYGADMDRLWGSVEPVPAANVTALAGGERIAAGGRRFEVAYTPGHASHHVSFYDRTSGVAFVGDTAGVCINGGYVLPPTPPPDIDPDLWRRSIGLIEAWSPQTLLLTHFGPVETVGPHLQALVENLSKALDWVSRSLSQAGTDEDRMGVFAREMTREFHAHPTGGQRASYQLVAPLDQLWLGLARFLRGR